MNTDDIEQNQQKPIEKEKLILKIDAHVVRQLGAELISGPEIALLELVKNSFDADANYCHISIDTNYSELIDGVLYSGMISIQDNGHGMSRDAINRGWLTISHSDKRLAKSKGVKSGKYARNFTGDKGLGRLGSMQLGKVCRIKTQNHPDLEGLEVYFNWDHVKHGRTLDSVDIHEKNLPSLQRTGSTIEIVGLNDLGYWQTEKNLTKLKYQLSSMISPFGHLKNFAVYLKIEGIEHELETFNEKVKGLCISQFDFKVENEKVITKGIIKLNNFMPADQADKANFDAYIKSDNGKGLFDYLANEKTLNDYAQTYLKDSAYFIEFYREIEIKDISTTKKKLKRKGVIATTEEGDSAPRFSNPGYFDGKIYQFAFVKDSLQLADITFNETKTLVQALTGGVSAYRDGFRIGSKRSDWLGLADEMTSGGGAYSLRPGNTAGFINLTWEHNPDLQEKSDRESFIENEAYEGFFILCQEIISSINTYLNKSRRASLLYGRLCKEKDGDKPDGYSGKHAVAELSEITSEAQKTYMEVQQKNYTSQSIFNDTKKHLDLVIEKNEQSLLHDPGFVKLVNEVKQKAAELENDFKKYALGYEEFTKRLSDHILSVDKIKYEIESYETQIKAFYDHVAIGLSAQALAHEANAQINNIHVHLNSALSRLKELNIKDVSLTRNLLSIRGDSQVLSKSISSLNPLIRSQRNIIDTLYLDKEIENYLELRIEYFKNKGIDVRFLNKNLSKAIKFNKGKLFQVIDNIVRNSEHWLEVYATHNPTEELFINIELEKNAVRIWDSGRGIRHAMEDVLFDMFASDKEGGQGLGLFIVRSLLEERGCSITLLHEKNKFERRYKFEIDFLEAME